MEEIISNEHKLMIIGGHQPKDKTFLKTIENTLNYGNNAVSIFTSSPQDMKMVVLNEPDVAATREFVRTHKITLVSHLKYIYNFARPHSGKMLYTIKVAVNELTNIAQLGGIGGVLHFGKSIDMPIKEALNNMYLNIIDVIGQIKDLPIKLILETSSGQGSEMLTNIPDIGSFYKRFTPVQQAKLGFCIDTCHIFAAGYDIRTLAGAKSFLKLWKKNIGLEKISLCHLNDSKMPLGSRKDRHEYFGEGYITNPELGGSEKGIQLIVKILVKLGVPIILERGVSIDVGEIDFVRSLVV